MSEEQKQQTYCNTPTGVEQVCLNNYRFFLIIFNLSQDFVQCYLHRNILYGWLITAANRRLLTHFLVLCLFWCLLGLFLEPWCDQHWDILRKPNSLFPWLQATRSWGCFTHMGYDVQMTGKTIGTGFLPLCPSGDNWHCWFSSLRAGPLFQDVIENWKI